MFTTYILIALPAITECIFMHLGILIITLFANNLSDTALAGVGIGSAFNELLCITLLTGLNQAQQTLVSQAYGYGNLSLCGVLLNRGRIIVILIFVPLTLMMSYSDSILEALNQDAEVTQYAFSYILLSTPGTFFFLMFDLTRKFLNSMTITWIPMTAQLFATAMLPFWCHVMLEQYDGMILGLAMAYNMTQFILFMTVTILAYLKSEIRAAMVLPEAG